MVDMAVCRQTVLEKELRVLHLNLKATGHELRHWHGLSIYETSKPTPTVTHFLQQGHTYLNEVTPPNSATPYEIVGVNYLQSATVCMYT